MTAPLVTRWAWCLPLRRSLAACHPYCVTTFPCRPSGSQRILLGCFISVPGIAWLEPDTWQPSLRHKYLLTSRIYLVLGCAGVSPEHRPHGVDSPVGETDIHTDDSNAACICASFFSLSVISPFAGKENPLPTSTHSCGARPATTPTAKGTRRAQ